MAESPGVAVTSTCRVRRRDLESGDQGEASSQAPALVPKPPPLPPAPPGRFGDLTRASIQEITGLAAQPPVPVSASTIGNRRHGVGMILRHLAGFDGATWQERWEAAGLDGPDRPVAGLSGHRRTRQLLLGGMRLLFQWRVVRPGLAAVHANHLVGYAEPFRQMQDDPLLDAFFDLVDASQESHTAKLAAKFDITAAMTAFGICLADMTPEGMLCSFSACSGGSSTPTCR